MVWLGVGCREYDDGGGDDRVVESVVASRFLLFVEWQHQRSKGLNVTFLKSQQSDRPVARMHSCQERDRSCCFESFSWVVVRKRVSSMQIVKADREPSTNSR